MNFLRKKAIKSALCALSVCLLTTVLLTACDNPTGLGARVNTDVPVIDQPGGDNVISPGSFLSGSENELIFEITQDFGLREVFIEVDFVDANNVQHRNHRIDVLETIGRTFTFNINTVNIFNVLQEEDWDGEALKMRDGQIAVRVTAIDVSGNRTTTTDIIYRVKNAPPQIRLTIPFVRDEGFDYDDEDVTTNFLRIDDPVFLRTDLMGVATDARGIAPGYPQIMLWPADHTTVDSDDIPTDPKWGIWRTVELPTVFDPTAVTFSWPLRDPETDVELMPGLYRFRLRVKDLAGVYNYYPNRADNTLGVAPADHPNQFMEVSLIDPAGLPIIFPPDTIPVFNGVGDDFRVTIEIESQNDLSRVWVWVTGLDNNMESEEIELNFVSQDGIRHIYELTIKGRDAVDTDGNVWQSRVLTLNFAAIDVESGRSPRSSRPFTFDTTPPVVAFDRPVSVTGVRHTGDLGQGGRYRILRAANVGATRPAWVTGEIIVGGAAEDPLAGIARIYYHIGSLGDDAEGADRVAILNGFEGWINTNLHRDPEINSGEPADRWGGNLFNWTYTRNFNDWRRDYPDDILEHHEVGYTNANTNFVTTGDGVTRFFLPFYVKVVDNAGNFYIVNYKLAIDPELDVPQAFFTSPNPDNTAAENIIGGTVRLQGTAGDDNWVYGVLVRVRRADGSFYRPPGRPFFNFAIEHPSALDLDIPPGDRDNWFLADLMGQGMSVGWFVNLNSANGLNPTVGDETIVRIETRAIDSKDQGVTPHRVGFFEDMEVTFSTGVPVIGNPTITGGYNPSADGGFWVDEPFTPGIMLGGEFTMDIVIRASVGEGVDIIQSIEMNINNHRATIVQGGSSQSATIPGVTWEISGGAGSYRERTLTLTFDTTTGGPGSLPIFGFGTGGNLNVSLTVHNSRTPSLSSTASYTIAIDNFFPNMAINTPHRASGAQFSLGGLAADHVPGSPGIPVTQALERVLIFFENAEFFDTGTARTLRGNGTFRNQLGQVVTATSDPATSPFITRPIMDMAAVPPPTVNAPNVPNFAFFPRLVEASPGSWTSPAAIVIGSDQFTGTIVDRAWATALDTTRFDDGPLMVHYIVMDVAGNATRYTRHIFIQNNRPVIDSINLGTDIGNDGNVTGSDFLGVIPIGNTADNNRQQDRLDFRVRNRRFGIALATTGGNGQLRYRVSQVVPGGTIAASAMQPGQVYSIATLATGQGAMTNWSMFGAPPNSAPGTVFVATGPGDGTGTVRVYNDANAWTKTGNLTGTIILGDTDFGATTTTINDGERLFIVKVFDNAVSEAPITQPGGQGGTEYDQLAHAVLVRVTVENADSAPPVISVADFGMEYRIQPGMTTVAGLRNGQLRDNESQAVSNYERNIVMDGSVRQGFVQYAEHSTTLTSGPQNADVSGRVIFTGKATDNQRIGRITAQIPLFNGGAAFDIATAGAGGLITPVTGNASWSFEIEPNQQHLTLQGHALTWRFAFDTSARANEDNVRVIFRVYDAADNGPPTTLPTPPTPLPPSASAINVNIAPFISGIETTIHREAPAFARTARGWYPVRQGEDITIRGFNFGTTRTVFLGGSGGIDGDSLGAGTPVTGGISVNIGSTASSGELRVEVDGINSLNSRTDVTAPYNQEPSANHVTLTNRRNLYVWNTGFLINDTNIANPIMRMNNGNRFIAYGTFDGTGRLMLRRNNDTTVEVANQTNRYINIGLAVQGTGAGRWIMAASNITAGQANLNLYHNTWGTGSSNANGADSGAGQARRRVQNLGNDPFRTRVPRVAINVDNMLFGYFDAVNESITVHTATRGTTGAWSGTVPNANATTPTAANLVANAGTTRSGSEFLAVGIQGTNAVIAWFDEDTQRLYFSHQPFSSVGTGGGTASRDRWQNNAIRILEDEPIGMHIDMVVDSNGIHLAYVHARNDSLYYTFIPLSDGNPDVGNRTTVRVDTIASNLMLSVRGGRPYITYYGTGQNRNSVRVAWSRAATPDAVLDGINTNNEFTGHWEVMAIPGENRPIMTEFVSNGVAATVTGAGNAWVAPAGSTLSGQTNMNQTILVGYMTTSWYEGAVIIGNIYTLDP